MVAPIVRVSQQSEDHICLLKHYLLRTDSSWMFSPINIIKPCCKFGLLVAFAMMARMQAILFPYCFWCVRCNVMTLVSLNAQRRAMHSIPSKPPAAYSALPRQTWYVVVNFRVYQNSGLWGPITITKPPNVGLAFSFLFFEILAQNSIPRIPIFTAGCSSSAIPSLPDSDMVWGRRSRSPLRMLIKDLGGYWCDWSMEMEGWQMWQRTSRAMKRGKDCGSDWLWIME